jgi:hypothetical protein
MNTEYEYKTIGLCNTGRIIRFQGQSHESSRDIAGSYYALENILLQAKGDHLDRVHSDQIVLEMIRRGRLAQ